MDETKAARPQTARPTNGMAIASLVMGILSFTFLPLIGNILAIIFGFVAKDQIKKTHEDGDGLALAGILIGAIPLIIALVIIAVVIIIALVSASFKW